MLLVSICIHGSGLVFFAGFFPQLPICGKRGSYGMPFSLNENIHGFSSFTLYKCSVFIQHLQADFEFTLLLKDCHPGGSSVNTRKMVCRYCFSSCVWTGRCTAYSREQKNNCMEFIRYSRKSNLIFDSGNHRRCRKKSNPVNLNLISFV